MNTWMNILMNIYKIIKIMVEPQGVEPGSFKIQGCFRLTAAPTKLGF
jgi:hypothetical protein